VDDTGDSRRRGEADPQAVDGAIRRHDRMLVRWLAQKFGDIEIARDIAQSAYLRVWRYAQTQAIDNPQALLFKTAANLAANEFRARKRLLRLTAEAPQDGSANPIEQIASLSPSPEATTLAREEVAASIEAINALPEQVRRAFILSRFEEKTYREIAVMLGVSESSVEKYIISALKALRKAAKDADFNSKVIPLPSRRDRA